MKRVIAIATATILMLIVALTFSVAAQDFNKLDRTLMTFSGAIELPGMRLEPGTYIFKIGDNPSRNIVQVLTEDGKKTLGQWFFIPANRREVSGETVITFRETSAGSTPAVQFWYYPGELIGKELIYPKDQAMRIAQRTGATVQTEDGPITASAQAPIHTDTQSAQVAVAPTQDYNSTSSAPSQSSNVASGSSLPSPSAEVVGTTGSADQAGSVRQESTYAQNNTSAQSELPRTASPLPLSGLIALLSFAGAAGIRAFRL